MKNIKILLLTIAVFVVGYSCSDDNDEISRSIPKINTLTILDNATEIAVPDSVYFNITVSDGARPLSTLEAEVYINDILVFSKTLRTKGNEFSIEKESLFIPFTRDLEDQEDVVLKFTSINVDGDQVSEEKILKAKRPLLPAVLYYIIDEDNIVELKQDPADLYNYASDVNLYDSKSSGKIATSKDLKESQYIWGNGMYANEASIVDEDGGDIVFDYAGWLVSRIYFNTKTFMIDVEGSVATQIVLADREDPNDKEMKSSIVSFKEGELFELKGIPKGSDFNPDFFEYNESIGVYRFLGEAGDWEVIYSPKYKAIWVTKMQDVAPETYWIVGHGFTTATVWHEDFMSVGWDLDNFKQVSYMRKLDTDKYQATIYISNNHEWESFEMQIYSNRTWDAAFPTFADNRVTGDKQGVIVGDNPASLTSGEGFTPGYFKLTLDISKDLSDAKINFQRLD